MKDGLNIWANNAENIVNQYDMRLLQQVTQNIPNAIGYKINRYVKPENWMHEDAGQLVYHYNKKNTADSYLQLQFCITGNQYCFEKNKECDRCRNAATNLCEQKIPSVDVMSFSFSPALLSQFFVEKNDNEKFDNIIKFRNEVSFTTALQICYKTKQVLANILNHNYSGSHANIYINAQTQMLLLYALECVDGVEKEPVFACKFLNTADEREKIIKAREVLLQHIGEPLTIKALSRKVAINECYLKKGFKELFGQTIFDFYQSQRMEHAKYLLYTKGLSVTDVSELLGYSSISHFSTAFKKLTGLKPCELLLK